MVLPEVSTALADFMAEEDSTEAADSMVEAVVSTAAVAGTAEAVDTGNSGIAVLD